MFFHQCVLQHWLRILLLLLLLISNWLLLIINSHAYGNLFRIAHLNQFSIIHSHRLPVWHRSALQPVQCIHHWLLHIWFFNNLSMLGSLHQRPAEGVSVRWGMRSVSKPAMLCYTCGLPLDLPCTQPTVPWLMAQPGGWGGYTRLR